MNGIISFALRALYAGCKSGQGKPDAAFRTKPRSALELVEKVRHGGYRIRGDRGGLRYGENSNSKWGCASGGSFMYWPVLASRSSATGGWSLADAAFMFREATQNVLRGAWQAVQGRLRDGHVEIWVATELTLAGYGPGKKGRAVCATTDPSTLPEISTWYLTTNLARAQAPLSEIVRLYGQRSWVEQSYKQLKD